MGIGSSIFLLAAGAILRFAVFTSVHGIAVATIGVILMIAGALGLVLTLTVWGPGSYAERRGTSSVRRTERSTMVDPSIPGVDRDVQVEETHTSR